MPDLTVSIANCELLGEQRTILPGGGWILNRIGLTVSGLRISIVQRPELFDRNGNDRYIVGECQHTTDIVIHDIAAHRVEFAKRKVQDLCWLMQFMAMSQVGPFAWEYRGSKQIKRLRGVLIRHISTVEMNDGKAVREFVETVWKSYLRLNRPRQLKVLFDYIVCAEVSGQPFEIKLAILFVALEHLVTTFARSKKIATERNRFVRPVWDPKKNRLAMRPYSFMELFNAMLKEAHMKKGFKRIRKVRNEITHFGRARKPLSSLIRDYETLQGFFREYILRLLGFKGRYIGYRERTLLSL